MTLPRAVAVLTFTLCSRSLVAAALSICSFNIQFLGNAPKRDNAALASAIQRFDVVLVQELIAPPFKGTYPDGTAFKTNARSARFFDEMKQRGFEFVLSEEDTGPGTVSHINTSATEWWVAFYKPAIVRPATALPHGFLSDRHYANPDWDRVPYAFSFSTSDSATKVILVSVHLRPGAGLTNRKRRKQELNAISKWIGDHQQPNTQFLVLGDMNIENAAELKEVTPAGFMSLNWQCLPTNTNIKGPKPYDHVMYSTNSNHQPQNGSFGQIGLVKTMEPFWKIAHPHQPYPGAPKYFHDAFRAVYSDHDPVFFKTQPP